MAADYSFSFGRVTISGTCFNATEQWSTGFQLGDPAAASPDWENVAGQIAAAWTTFFQNSLHSISANYKTDQVKIAEISVTGQTVDSNIDYYTYPTPIGGGGTSSVHPAQITLAATMTSEIQRGLAAKGRMYLPGINAAVDSGTGKITSTVSGNLATGVKTLFDTINANVGVPGNVILASKGHRTQQLDANGQPVYENGVSTLVTGCRVGDVFDTQRRRRNDLTETYTARVLA